MDKLLVKWERHYEVCSRHREVDVHIPGVELKRYHVKLLKKWKDHQGLSGDLEGALANKEWQKYTNRLMKGFLCQLGTDQSGNFRVP